MSFESLTSHWLDFHECVEARVREIYMDPENKVTYWTEWLDTEDPLCPRQMARFFETEAQAMESMAGKAYTLHGPITKLQLVDQGVYWVALRTPNSGPPDFELAQCWVKDEEVVFVLFGNDNLFPKDQFEVIIAANVGDKP